jgi:hypothetical protein
MEKLRQGTMLQLGVKEVEYDELFLDDTYLKNVLDLNFVWHFCKMATTLGLHT